MRVLFVLLIIFFKFNHILFGEEIKKDYIEIENVKKNIQLVIINQLKAFELNDFKTGYNYASENIKRLFPSYILFKEMIISSYPMIYKPKSYEFVQLRTHAGYFFQRVLFVDENNKIYYFDYQMIKTSNNFWLINGVYRIIIDQENV